MAVAVEAVSGLDAQGATITQSFTVTAANLLLVAVSAGDSAHDVTIGAAPTWNGTSLTLVASSKKDDGNWAAVAWYQLASPATGTHNVVLSQTMSQQCVHIIGLTGYVSLGTPSTATGTSANPSVTVVDSGSGDIVVAVCSNDNAVNPTTEANTLIFEKEDLAADTDHNSQYKTASGSSTVMSWTQSQSGDGWAASGLAIKAAAPSGGFLNRNFWWDNL